MAYEKYKIPGLCIVSCHIEASSKTVRKIDIFFPSLKFKQNPSSVEGLVQTRLQK